MSKKNRERVSQQAAEVLAQTETSKPAPVATPTASRPDSIRQTIRAGLLAGNTTEQIAVVLKEKFPTSKAALKAAKHIAFYRSKMRKAGELPAKGAEVPAPLAG